MAVPNMDESHSMLKEMAHVCHASMIIALKGKQCTLSDDRSLHSRFFQQLVGNAFTDPSTIIFLAPG